MKIQLKLEEQILHEISADDLTAEIVIGRGSNTTWTLPKDQKKASSRHATISREGDSIVLHDLNSTNGTYLNGERISSRVLKVGDELRIGQAWVLVTEGARAARDDGHCLVIRTGPETGRVYPVRDGLNTIGSAADCNIQLNDPIVSQQHAELRLGPSGCTIKDLGSTNGTVLGKVRIPANQEVPMRMKDNLFIAHYGLVFTHGGKAPRRRNWMPLIIGLVGAFVILVALLLMSLLGGGSGKNLDLAGLADGRLSIQSLLVEAEGTKLQEPLERYAAIAETLSANREKILQLADPLPELGEAAEFEEERLQEAYDAQLEPERQALVALRSFAKQVQSLPDEAGTILADWKPGGALDQALEFDCLKQPPPPATRSRGSSAYDRLLGVESFYLFMFEESDTFDLKPTEKTPFTPAIEALKPLVPICLAATRDLPEMDADTALGKQSELLSSVGATLKGLVPEPPYRNREMVLRAAMARYLEVPGVRKNNFVRGFQTVRDLRESAIEGEMLSVGLPGDPSLQPAWNKVLPP